MTTPNYRVEVVLQSRVVIEVRAINQYDAEMQARYMIDHEPERFAAEGVRIEGRNVQAWKKSMEVES